MKRLTYLILALAIAAGIVHGQAKPARPATVVDIMAEQMISEYEDLLQEFVKSGFSEQSEQIKKARLELEEFRKTSWTAPKLIDIYLGRSAVAEKPTDDLLRVLILQNYMLLEKKAP